MTGPAVDPADLRWTWDQPVPPRWLLIDEYSDGPTAAVAVRHDIVGLFSDLDPAPPATLVGCRPEPPLRDALAALARPGSAARRRRITATILAVEADGTAVSTMSRNVSAHVVSVRPSAVGDALLDVTFDDGVDPFPAGAREIWDRWHLGRPTVPNQWAGYDRTLRHEWSGAALARHPHGGSDRPAGRAYHLDGRFVTDVEGFYCALGEAVNGPGGYFGWNLDALDDCLRGRWGAAAPFRLEWHDAETARRHLLPGWDAHRDAPAVTMDYLLGMFAEHGILIELR